MEEGIPLGQAYVVQAAGVGAPPLAGDRNVPPAIRAGTRVVVKDREVGTVALVLTDPTTGDATHLVIRDGRFSSRRVIALGNRVIDATVERIILDLSPDELATLSEYRPDDELAAAAERAIGNDDIIRRLSARALEVTACNGVVTVTGNIATSIHRQRIADSVRGVRGVLGLQNLPIGDDELETAVAQALGRDPRTRRFIIPVQARLGFIRLSGDVPAVAIDLARTVPGVRGVRTA